jgi:hypothetical protein
MTAGPALEMWSRQNGTAASPDSKQYSLSMVRAFSITIDASDALEVAYTASGLPLINDSYPGWQYVLCRKLSPQRVSPILVIMTVEYSGEVGINGPDSSPEDVEVDIEWTNAVTDELIDQDFEGKPMVTKNNEPIDGISEKVSDQVLTVERNFLSINMYAIRAYLRAVNSDQFADWPAGTCRMMRYSAKNRITNGVGGYWRVSVVFQFREPYNTTAEKAWYKRVRHEGYLVRDNASDPVEAAHKAWDGVKGTSPKMVLLKEDGTIETDPDSAHWLEFKTLGELPFSALGLF